MEPRARRGVAIIAAGCLIVAALGVAYFRGALPLAGPAPAASSTPPPIRAILPVRTVTFADATHGCVLFGYQAATANGVLYVTEDGGRHWRHALLRGDVALVQVVDRWHLVTFPSHGSTIWISADFGRTWRSAPIPISTTEARPAALSFVDARHAWLIQAVGDPIAGPSGFRLWWTDDGGRQWRQVTAAGLPQGTAAAPLFLDTKRGVAIANPGGRVEVPLLYLTSDGGSTWHQGTFPRAPLVAGNILFWRGLFRADGRLLSLYGQPGGATMLTVSDDGGQTWGPFTDVPGAASARILAGGGVLASFVGGELWTSDDGGQHWASRTVNFPRRFLAPRLTAVTSGALFVEAGPSPGLVDTLFRSADGGAHWERLPLPVVVDASG